ncbi:ABC transporter ATP-binding protein [Ponticaulis sp.]|uniref:ABC transporter ATP-binding protein n=1 Tax=Ponticaulis sp. TaxID=2020902 RepID=UPI000B74C851|nr:ABC transporter ATP-binding protein [Ponticaulis sp.]MAI91825.1 iron ABC transporter ATP-binding protein [Ponticaulis sp.]OUX96696.1 MAG: hypothetical protein CBB65_15450 [Hyphomonadaceae bacterium TMED5]|tara:strand:+ start:24738 stop:25496 length:759 start_codon:yes stop_codon:yes gene_type:complete
MTRLEARNIYRTQKDISILSNVSLPLQTGKLTCLIGPNGAGKSTLLRTMCGLDRPTSGEVLLNEQPIQFLSHRERARLIGYLPQSRPLAWPIPVRDAVALGRFAYGARPEKLSPKDAQAVDQAIHDCGLTALQHRATNTLSGGELSRVHLARAFAGEAPVLIADEPLSALDPKHQLRVMNLFRDYTAKGGTACVVLHDISIAAQFACELVWMKSGKILASGPPQETLTSVHMETVFEVQAEISDGRLRDLSL